MGVWTSTSLPNIWRSTRRSCCWRSEVWTETTMVGDEFTVFCRNCLGTSVHTYLNSDCLQSHMSTVYAGAYFNRDLLYCVRAHRCLGDPAEPCRAGHGCQQRGCPENLTEVWPPLLPTVTCVCQQKCCLQVIWRLYLDHSLCCVMHHNKPSVRG